MLLDLAFEHKPDFDRIRNLLLSQHLTSTHREKTDLERCQKIFRELEKAVELHKKLLDAKDTESSFYKWTRNESLRRFKSMDSKRPYYYSDRHPNFCDDFILKNIAKAETTTDRERVRHQFLKSLAEKTIEKAQQLESLGENVVDEFVFKVSKLLGSVPKIPESRLVNQCLEKALVREKKREETRAALRLLQSFLSLKVGARDITLCMPESEMPSLDEVDNGSSDTKNGTVDKVKVFEQLKGMIAAIEEEVDPRIQAMADRYREAGRSVAAGDSARLEGFWEQVRRGWMGYYAEEKGSERFPGVDLMRIRLSQVLKIDFEPNPQGLSDEIYQKTFGFAVGCLQDAVKDRATDSAAGFLKLYELGILSFDEAVIRRITWERFEREASKLRGQNEPEAMQTKLHSDHGSNESSAPAPIKPLPYTSNGWNYEPAPPPSPILAPQTYKDSRSTNSDCSGSANVSSGGTSVNSLPNADEPPRNSTSFTLVNPRVPSEGAAVKSSPYEYEPAPPCSPLFNFNFGYTGRPGASANHDHKSGNSQPHYPHPAPTVQPPSYPPYAGPSSTGSGSHAHNQSQPPRSHSTISRGRARERENINFADKEGHPHPQDYHYNPPASSQAPPSQAHPQPTYHGTAAGGSSELRIYEIENWQLQLGRGNGHWQNKRQLSQNAGHSSGVSATLQSSCEYECEYESAPEYEYESAPEN